MWFFQADSILMSTSFTATVPVGSQTPPLSLISSTQCTAPIICRSLNSDSLRLASPRVFAVVNWLRWCELFRSTFLPSQGGREGVPVRTERSICWLWLALSWQSLQIRRAIGLCWWNMLIFLRLGRSKQLLSASFPCGPDWVWEIGFPDGLLATELRLVV